MLMQFCTMPTGSSFVKTTSAIIVFTGSAFIFLVGMATMVLFCLHRYRDKQRQKKQALNPTSPHNWIRNQNRASVSSSSLWIPMSQGEVYNSCQQPGPLEAWRNDIRYVRNTQPYSHLVNTKWYHLPRRNSCTADPTFCRKYHGNIDKMASYDPYSKRWPRLIPDYHTYPCASLKSAPSPMYGCSEVSSHGENSPGHLLRMDSSSVLSDEAMYHDEFGHSDQFYTGITAL